MSSGRIRQSVKNMRISRWAGKLTPPTIRRSEAPFWVLCWELD
jgi:hypothetical protein